MRETSPCTKQQFTGPRARSVLVTATSIGALCLAALTFTTSTATAAAVNPGLGTATSFGVLAGAGITNTGTTTVTGDIGSFPTLAITGAGTMTISGENHGGDAVTQQAKLSTETAYTNLAGQLPPIATPVELGGQTLVGGVYNSGGALALTGSVTLDGKNNPDSIWVFQSASTLITASNSSVSLINGAQACNVFWQVSSSATLGTDTDFVGNILARTSISANTGADIDGRLLALDGAVTLQSNRIFRSNCSPPDETTTTTTAPVTTTTPPDDSPTGSPTTQATPPLTLPSIPGLPPLTLPSIPGLPSLPTIPGLPGTPETPGTSETPGTPGTTSPAPDSGQSTTPEAPSPGRQVPNVPRGSIDTGDGSSIPNSARTVSVS